MTAKWGGRKPSATQIAILGNVLADRRYDLGRPATRSDAAGWGCAYTSCFRRGWLARNREPKANRPVEVTEAGMAVLELWVTTR